MSEAGQALRQGCSEITIIKTPSHANRGASSTEGSGIADHPGRHPCTQNGKAKKHRCVQVSFQKSESNQRMS